MASEWFIKINDVEHGPFTPERLKQLAQQGKVTPETLVKQGASGTWLRASHITGLFPTATSAGTPAKAVPLPKRGSPPTIPTAKVRFAVPPERPNVPTTLPPTQALPPVVEEKGHLVRNVGIAAGIITVLLIVLLVVPDMTRDKWELNNSNRVVAKLKEADQLKQRDPYAAYKVYDEVLREASQHKVTGEMLSEQLAAAEISKTAVYAKVKDKIQAEEAEKQRLAQEEACAGRKGKATHCRRGAKIASRRG